MINPNDIKIRRLKDAPVKGNFTINCENEKEFYNVKQFFNTTKDYIKFRDIKECITPYMDTPTYLLVENILKFTIKYESLNELLKLREVFNIRANKFDMYLINKRGYNPFTPDFYTRCADPVIYKVKK
jgi:hypothetical protein